MTRRIRTASRTLALVALASACATERPEHAGLAFTRYASAEESSVWVADADGSDTRKLAADGYQPTLSPDGRRVAYSVTPGDEGFLELFVRKVDGGEALRIGNAFEHAWSPDGTRLAVADRTALRLVDAASGVRSTVATGDVRAASFAPDGKALAYARGNGKVGREYRSDVFVVRLSTGATRQLTHDRHSDSPVLGRRWIVYRSFHFDGDWSIGRLRLVRPDGSGDRFLARGDERTGQAQMGLRPLELSDNGKRLLACAAAEFHCPPVAFTVPGGEAYELRTEEDPAIVRTQELAYAADLAKDGSEVLFDVGPFDGPAGHRVYSLPFEGGKPRLLVRDAVDPSWAR